MNRYYCDLCREETPPGSSHLKYAVTFAGKGVVQLQFKVGSVDRYRDICVRCMKKAAEIFAEKIREGTFDEGKKGSK